MYLLQQFADKVRRRMAISSTSRLFSPARDAYGRRRHDTQATDQLCQIYRGSRSVRYSVGERPRKRRKVRLKWGMSEKPDS